MGWVWGGIPGWVGWTGIGLGPGWGLSGVGSVEVTGGVRVRPASGGVYEVDAQVPSGLAGYTLADVVFTQESGVLPARARGGG